MCIGKPFTRRSTLAALPLAAAALAVASNAASAEVGGAGHVDLRDIAAGDASFDYDDGHLQITAADGTIINYDQFDIPLDEIVEFVQPHDLARVLNRIHSTDPSQIDGSLLANGIVYLANPSGIIFGPDAVIDVGQLYAAAGDITDSDFLDGTHRFITGDGELINHGEILADADVALIGDKVFNYGVISAPDGVVSLTSGDDVYLQQQGSTLLVMVDGIDPHTGHSEEPAPETLPDDPGVSNEGQVHAGQGAYFSVGDVYSLALENEGEITTGGGELVMAGHGKLSHSGDVDTADPDDADAGNVRITADRIEITGQIDTRSQQNGGDILIGTNDHSDGDTLADSILISNANLLAGEQLTARANSNRSGTTGIQIDDNTTVTAHDDMLLEGSGAFLGSDNIGIHIQNAELESTAGRLRIFGDGGAGSDSAGIHIRDASLSSAGGPLVVEGESGESHGLLIEGPSAGTATTLTTEAPLLRLQGVGASGITIRGNTRITNNQFGEILIHGFGGESPTTHGLALEGTAAGSPLVEADLVGLVRLRGFSFTSSATGISIHNATVRTPVDGDLRLTGHGMDLGDGTRLLGPDSDGLDPFDPNQGVLIARATLESQDNPLRIHASDGVAIHQTQIFSSGDTQIGHSPLESPGQFVHLHETTIDVDGMFLDIRGQSTGAADQAVLIENSQLTVDNDELWIDGRQSAGNGVLRGVVLRSDDAENPTTLDAYQVHIDGRVTVDNAELGSAAIYFNDNVSLNATNTSNFADTIRLDARATYDQGNAMELRGQLDSAGGITIRNHTLNADPRPLLLDGVQIGGGRVPEFRSDRIALVNNPLVNPSGWAELMPDTSSMSIGIGDGASGDFLVDTELLNVFNVSDLRIGQSSGNHQINAGAVDTSQIPQLDLELRAGTGSITIDGPFDLRRLTLDAEHVNLQGDIELSWTSSFSASLQILADELFVDPAAEIDIVGLHLRPYSFNRNVSVGDNVSGGLELNSQTLDTLDPEWIEIQAQGAGSQFTVGDHTFTIPTEFRAAGSMAFTGDIAVENNPLTITQGTITAESIATIDAPELHLVPAFTSYDIGIGIDEGQNLVFHQDLIDALTASTERIIVGDDGSGRHQITIDDITLPYETEIHAPWANSFAQGRVHVVGELAMTDAAPLAMTINESAHIEGTITTDGGNLDIEVLGEWEPEQLPVALLLDNDALIDTAGGNLSLLNHGGTNITISGDITTGTGSGGSLDLENVLLHATPEIGQGDLTIINTVDGPDPLVINDPSQAMIHGLVDDQGNLNLVSSGDIQINAPIIHEGGGIVLTADADGDGQGGILLNAPGQILSEGDVSMTGSSLVGAAQGDALHLTPTAQGPISAAGEVALVGTDAATADIRLMRDVAVTEPGAELAITSSRGIELDDLSLSTEGGTISMLAGGVLEAGDEAINLDAVMADTAGGNVLVGTDASDIDAASVPAAEGIRISSGSTWSTAGGDLAIHGVRETTARDGVLIGNSTFQTGTGSIAIRGKGGVGSDGPNRGIWAGRMTLTTQSGPISLQGIGGEGGSDNSGIALLNDSQISSDDGAISIHGRGGSGDGGEHRGLDMRLRSQIHAGSGDIVLDASGGDGGQWNWGIAIAHDETALTTDTGNITIDGTGGTGSDAQFGLTIQRYARVASSAGNITLEGTAGTGDAGSIAHRGVSIHDAGLLHAEQGNLTIRGTGGSSTDGGGQHAGVHITRGSELDADTGILQIKGTGGTGGSDNHGVEIFASDTQITTRTGQIHITGTAASGSDSHGLALSDTQGSPEIAAEQPGSSIRLAGESDVDDAFGVHLDGVSIAWVDSETPLPPAHVETDSIGVGANQANTFTDVLVWTVPDQAEAAGFWAADEMAISGEAGTGHAAALSVVLGDSDPLVFHGMGLAEGAARSLTFATDAGLSFDARIVASGSASDLTLIADADNTGAGDLNLLASTDILTGRDLILAGDSITLDPLAELSGQGQFRYEPAADAAIAVNADLTDALAPAIGQFGGITIGRPDGSHQIDIDVDELDPFNDPMTFQAPAAGGQINIHGDETLLFTGDASATFIGPGETTFLAADIATQGSPVSFADAVIVEGQRTVDTTDGGQFAGGDVAFQGPVNAQTAGVDTLGIDAGTTGNVAFAGAVGQNNALGSLAIQQANNVSFDQPVTASSVSVNNHGTFTQAPGAHITAADGFNQTGPGPVALGAGVSTDGAPIAFTGPVTLTDAQAVVLDTTMAGQSATGAAINLPAVDAQTGSESLELIGGTGGDVTFTGPIGMGEPPSQVTVTSAQNVTGDVEIRTGAFEQTAGTGTTSLPNLYTDSGGADIQTDGPVSVSIGPLQQRLLGLEPTGPAPVSSEFAAEYVGAATIEQVETRAEEGTDVSDPVARSSEMLGLDADTPLDPMFAELFIVQLERFEQQRGATFQAQLLEAMEATGFTADQLITQLDPEDELYQDLVELAALLDLIDAMGLSDDAVHTAYGSLLERITPAGIELDQLAALIEGIRDAETLTRPAEPRP